MMLMTVPEEAKNKKETGIEADAKFKFYKTEKNLHNGNSIHNKVMKGKGIQF